MRRDAFTLVELIVVIAIIAILAAVIAPNAFKAVEKAKISRAVSDLKAIRSAAYAFYSDTGTIPCTKSGGWGEDPGFIKQITPSNCWATEGGCAAGCTDIRGWNGPYLEKDPVDPWGRRYQYACPGTHSNDYDLYSYGPKEKDERGRIVNWTTT